MWRIDEFFITTRSVFTSCSDLNYNSVNLCLSNDMIKIETCICVAVSRHDTTGFFLTYCSRFESVFSIVSSIVACTAENLQFFPNSFLRFVYMYASSVIFEMKTYGISLISNFR